MQPHSVIDQHFERLTTLSKQLESAVELSSSSVAFFRLDKLAYLSLAGKFDHEGLVHVAVYAESVNYGLHCDPKRLGC
jgi:hypothetical protein